MKYQIEPVKAVLNNDGFAVNTGYITLYNYDSVTYEFIISSIRQLPEGVGIPANSCLDAPIHSDDNTAVIRDVINNKWLYLADHRGKTIYNINDGHQRQVNFIGDLPTDYTEKNPTGEFDSWNGEEWIEDKEKALQNRITLAKQEYDNRLSEADNYIYDLNEAIELERATEDDIKLLKLWRQYRFDIKQININQPDLITWPEKPANPSFMS